VKPEHAQAASEMVRVLIQLRLQGRAKQEVKDGPDVQEYVRDNYGSESDASNGSGDEEPES
jgi:hypothetical protein